MSASTSRVMRDHVRSTSHRSQERHRPAGDDARRSPSLALGGDNNLNIANIDWAGDFTEAVDESGVFAILPNDRSAAVR